MRSTEGFVEVQRKREENLFQLALGLVLFRVQRNAGRHMHWEQPARSIMMRTPCCGRSYKTLRLPDSTCAE